MFFGVSCNSVSCMAKKDTISVPTISIVAVSTLLVFCKIPEITFDNITPKPLHSTSTSRMIFSLVFEDLFLPPLLHRQHCQLEKVDSLEQAVIYWEALPLMWL